MTEQNIVLLIMILVIIIVILLYKFHQRKQSTCKICGKKMDSLYIMTDMDAEFQGYACPDCEKESIEWFYKNT